MKKLIGSLVIFFVLSTSQAFAQISRTETTSDTFVQSEIQVTTKVGEITGAIKGVTLTDANIEGPYATLDNAIKAKVTKPVVITSEQRLAWDNATDSKTEFTFAPDATLRADQKVVKYQNNVSAKNFEVNLAYTNDIIHYLDYFIIREIVRPEAGGTFTTVYYKVVVDIDYKIGDVGPIGGTIVYVRPEAEVETGGWRYFELIPKAEVVEADWFTSTYKIPLKLKANSLDIGAGEANTKEIVDPQGLGVNALSATPTEWKPGNYYAAESCYKKIYNGATGWFLPSKKESMLIHDNMFKVWDQVRIDKEWADQYYWTSSITNNDRVYAQNLHMTPPKKEDEKDETIGNFAPRSDKQDGNLWATENNHYYSPKSKFLVRCIRAFGKTKEIGQWNSISVETLQVGTGADAAIIEITCDKDGSMDYLQDINLVSGWDNCEPMMFVDIGNKDFVVQCVDKKSLAKTYYQITPKLSGKPTVLGSYDYADITTTVTKPK